MQNSWKPFSDDSMPPVNNGKYFLICRGYRNPADQIMCTAKRVQYGDHAPYIRYIGYHGQGEFGWRVLSEDEYRDTVWQEIEYPS